MAERDHALVPQASGGFQACPYQGRPDAAPLKVGMNRHGRERVQNYIRDLAKDDGMNTRAITEKHFDKATCDQLTHSWIRHVNRRR